MILICLSFLQDEVSLIYYSSETECYFILIWHIKYTHWLSWFIPSEDPETEACILPPQKDILLLVIWH